MNISSCLQGFTNNPNFTYDSFKRLFSHKNIDDIMLCYAFVRKSGVKEICELYDFNNVNNKTAFVGINNGVTSRQGIELLYDLGFNIFLVDTGRQDCLMHIKFAQTISNNNIQILTGSSNLTYAALYNNFELNYYYEIKNSNKESYADLLKVADMIRTLPSVYPDNVKKLSKIDDLDELITLGLLSHEKFNKPTNTKNNNGSTSSNRIKTPKYPKPKKTKNVSHPTPSVISAPTTEGTLVWKKDNLSNSDAQITKGNVKGYITLGNKSFRYDLAGNKVDNKTYMKNIVFKDLHWDWDDKNKRYETSCMFSLYIDDKFIDEKVLMITDKPSREPAEHGGKNQSQPTTSLHISKFPKDQINTIHGKNLKLFKLDTNNYKIDIK